MAWSIGAVHEAISASRPDELALVFRDRRLTWADVSDRTRRLANVLHAAGLGCHTERSDLANWESGQDHLGIYCYNGNEYLEAMLGAFKARVAPFNVNYRYVADELRYLLVDAAPSALVFDTRFADTVAAVRADVPSLRLLLQVDDGTGELLPGAIWYEDALAAAPATPPPVTPSPDDLYILYTGGTTGMPKGVLWRQGDAWQECFGGSRTATTLDEVVAELANPLRAVVAPPFIPRNCGQLAWNSACVATGEADSSSRPLPSNFSNSVDERGSGEVAASASANKPKPATAPTAATDQRAWRER